MTGLPEVMSSAEEERPVKSECDDRIPVSSTKIVVPAPVRVRRSAPIRVRPQVAAPEESTPLPDASMSGIMNTWASGSMYLTAPLLPWMSNSKSLSVPRSSTKGMPPSGCPTRLQPLLLIAHKFAICLAFVSGFIISTHSCST